LSTGIEFDSDRVGWSVGLSVGLSVCLSVCHSVTLMSPAKTAEPIEMSFGLRIRVGPWNHAVLACSRHSGQLSLLPSAGRDTKTG